jgi:hypothetical protein
MTIHETQACREDDVTRHTWFLPPPPGFALKRKRATIPAGAPSLVGGLITRDSCWRSMRRIVAGPEPLQRTAGRGCHPDDVARAGRCAGGH